MCCRIFRDAEQISDFAEIWTATSRLPSRCVDHQTTATPNTNLLFGKYFFRHFFNGPFFPLIPVLKYWIIFRPLSSSFSFIFTHKPKMHCIMRHNHTHPTTHTHTPTPTPTYPKIKGETIFFRWNSIENRNSIFDLTLDAQQLDTFYHFYHFLWAWFLFPVR